MKQSQLFNAINSLAKELGLVSLLEVSDISAAPMQCCTLAQVAWYKQFPENENTKTIREYLSMNWYSPEVKFEEE